MTEMSRRGMLQAAGLLTVGAVTGCASPRSSGKDQAIFD